MTLNIIDLFAGCGGLLDGFLQEGHYHALASIEWEKAPLETLKERLRTRWGYKNAENETICFDIQRTEDLFNGFSDPKYGTHNGLDATIGKNHVDIIIGGPPCQAYSIAGRIRDPNGMRNDYRNYLFESYIKILKHYQPHLFVFENVMGLLSAKPNGTPIINDIIKAFNDANYMVLSNLKDAVFDVAEFGVPQHRKRIIILGIKTNMNDLKGVLESQQLLETFYRKIMPAYKINNKLTVKDAISDLPKLYPSHSLHIKNGKKFSHIPCETNIPNHVPRFHNSRDIDVFKLLAQDIKNGNHEYANINRLKTLYTEVTGKQSNVHKYYVLRNNEPSNTIPAHLYKDGMRHIHPDPEQARSITVREAARLQSFDDDFVFLGSMMAQYKMIGNAVPPKFARIIASAIYKLISS